MFIKSYLSLEFDEFTTLMGEYDIKFFGIVQRLPMVIELKNCDYNKNLLNTSIPNGLKFLCSKNVFVTTNFIIK